MQRPGEIRESPRWLRVLIPIAVAVGIVGGVSYLIEGRIAAGVFWLVAGLGLTALWLWRRRATRAGRTEITPSLRVQFYGFFGAGVVVGIVCFTEAVLGLTDEPVFWGALGLSAAASNVYAIVLGRRNERRMNQANDTQAKSVDP